MSFCWSRHNLPYLVLLLPLLLVLPAMFGFPYPINGESDLAVSHYPNAIFLLDSIRHWGELPLWSPLILSGYPFFANPLSGLGYLPGWAALLFPLPFGFNLLASLHLAWGGLGMVWLLRREGLGVTAALFGGLAFACLPKLYAHFGAGHLTLLYALPWTPWLLGASLPGEWKSESGSTGQPGWRVTTKSVFLLLLPGILLAMIFYADVRWAFLAAILWWAYAMTHRQGFSRGKILARLLVQGTCTLVLTAPLSVPLLEYTRLSTRAGMAAEDVLVYSLPPVRLIWMLFPDFGGFHEYMLYPGAVVLVLVLAAFSNRSIVSPRRFWTAVLLVSLVFAFGENIPGLRALVNLPGFNLLRVPSRALFLSGFTLAALSAYGLDSLYPPSGSLSRRRFTLSLLVLCTLAAALAAGIYLATGVLPPNLLWGTGAILLAALICRQLVKGGNRPRSWMLALFLLAIIDWSLVDRLAYMTRPTEQVLSEGAQVARFLADQPGRFRVYSPSYSLPQQTGARHYIEQADGVDPLQLEAYADFMEPATGVPRDGYSVTMPPFSTGSPRVDNTDYLPDPALLGLLGVRYVLADFELEVSQFSFVRRFGATRVYKNDLAKPLAWVQPETSSLGEAIQPVTIEDWQPNRILIRATGPGLLVLSEINYPGWFAQIGAETVEIVTVGGLFRAVSLGPGDHRVEFRFRPASLYRGWGILLSGVLLGLFILISWVNSKSR